MTGPINLWHHKTIMSINDTKKSARGRPPVDSEPVNLRLSRDLLEGVDAFRKEQSSLPTRPGAIRAILQDWLNEKGFLKS